ncbi:hypothetical protein GCM10023116_37350 [Kistimonas scapharcae]|uniref:PNPLA domain-containing protein n=2 Tax=Kistimonas scapharcae TaxID=1036133 RepID=A0ABP8V6L9_9GAMM
MMPPQTTTHLHFSMAGKTALVAEGGGMRGVFTAGVLDAFLVNNYNPFDLYIGCSAGALNLSSYIAGQYRHGYHTISDFTTRPEFYNWSRFLRGGHAIDLDWLWEATDRENPLQIDTAARQLGNREFLIGASHASAGEATYHHAVPSSWQQLLKASCAIPGLYRTPVMLHGQPYVDGGVADPIPVREAWLRGARRIIVIRTHSHAYREHRSWREHMAQLLLRHQPAVAEMIMTLEQRYNQACAFIERPPQGVEVIEIAPTTELATPMLSRNQTTLAQDYHAGCEAGMHFLYQQGICQHCLAA